MDKKEDSHLRFLTLKAARVRNNERAGGND